MIDRLLCTAGALAATMLLPAVAAAQDASSIYTQIDETCARRWLPDDPVMEIACAGAPGWSLYVTASEHGEAVAYASHDSVRSDWINVPMRSLFGSFHDVVEWRLHGDAPVATIHRYRHYTPAEAMGAGEAEQTTHTLVVTALRNGSEPAACPVAYVDASAIPDANTLARTLADDVAPGWDCGSEPARFDSPDDFAGR